MDNDFAAALECVTDEYSQLPDSEELVNKIRGKLFAFYDDPKLPELSAHLGQEVSTDFARRLAFSPSPQQIRSVCCLNFHLMDIDAIHACSLSLLRLKFDYSSSPFVS
jgi:hypothetical protein